MPDRGLLTRPDGAVPAMAEKPETWRLEDCKAAQLTFEVDQQAALACMPGDVSRPVPCYARLFVLEAGSSPVGPLRMASLMVGGRYRMMPRNVVVEVVVDGPVEQVEARFGAGVVPGRVSLERDGGEVVATIETGGQEVGKLTLPAPHAIDPTMLRWDPWLSFAAKGDVTQIIEFGPRPELTAAFLSKGATLETPAGIDRGSPWRRLRNLNTVSGSFVEGVFEFSGAEVQQALL